MDRPKVTEDMILRILNSPEVNAWHLMPDFSSFKSVNNALFTSYALGDREAVKICDDGKQSLHEVLAQMISHSLADTLEVVELYNLVCDVDVFKDVTGCDLETGDWMPYMVDYPEVYEFLYRKHEENNKIHGWTEYEAPFNMLSQFSEQDSNTRHELIAEVERINRNDDLRREAYRTKQAEILEETEAKIEEYYRNHKEDEDNE